MPKQTSITRLSKQSFRDVLIPKLEIEFAIEIATHLPFFCSLCEKFFVTFDFIKNWTLFLRYFS